MMLSQDRNQILIVGAGIQGLLTALAVNGPGTEVTIHSAGCDPRGVGDCRAATSAGEAGRLITPLEGHPYLGDSAMYPDMSGAMSATVSAGGWLGRPVENCTPAEQAWLHKRQVANTDASAIAETADWYARTSVASIARWRQMFEDRADLFAGTSLIADAGVFCFYDRPELAAIAAGVHRQLGTLKEEIDLAAVARQSPELAPACANGTLGGALRVEGYALDIKRLTVNLIHLLEQAGVRFVWDSVCRGIDRDDAGRVRGLFFGAGVVSADSYVIHPGAYAGEAFGEETDVDLAGVAGRWLLVPKPPAFNWPAKVHFSPRTGSSGDRRAVMDLNLMPYFDAKHGREFLAVGGGYLHVGAFPFRFDDSERQLLDDELQRAVRLLMPDWFAQCQAEGSMVHSNATCVRAFTPNDRPAVLCAPTDRDGHLLLLAGLNTGATAMAPAIAEQIAHVVRDNDLDAISLLDPANAKPSPASSRERVQEIAG